MRKVVGFYQKWFKNQLNIDVKDKTSSNLQLLLNAILENNDLPRLYVIIDEYDNFANQLITAQKDSLYHELTADDSFLKTFFKTLKEGRKTGAIANVFITGVLPITIDDMASGYNIANFITLRSKFENMLGFTPPEVEKLLDEIYHDHEIEANTRQEVEAIIKNHYDGYHFVNPDGEPLYNSTLLMYFLEQLVEDKTLPTQLLDMNLKTDISWVRCLTASNPSLTEEFVDQLTLQNNIGYDNRRLMDKFNRFQFFEKGFFPISFFHLGMLTKQDYFYLKLPNLNLRQIFVEYFNEIHHIDVSCSYTEIMQRFINEPVLSQLFAGYWEQYVSQLPEAIFQQVNENFYRTTFYELCSRYLSHWFLWHVERSYPQGKSDLEFVGKHNEKFAGLRWVIEFKYYSNTKFKELKTSIEKFELLEEKLLLPPLQTQFSVYTVVHFDNPVDFSQAEIREQLQPLLAALTHVEEPNHPGSLELVHKVMNPCHWAAVGTLGMAQLTAEQSPKQKFDRVSVVLNKYFMAYLSAYLQRLVLQRILNEASIVVRQKGTVENQAELQQLHSATLDFTITGYFTEISSREVLNQTYRLVQQGLRVPESFAMVQNTLHRIDVNKNARFQKEMSQDLNTMAKELNHNVDAVTGMHHKMEWLEVFFVSFYAMQLSQILSKSFHFVEVYSSWSVVSWPFVAGFMAFLGLQPHKRKRDKESKFDIYGPFLLLVIMVMIWFVVGYSFFRG
jgi:hypothetical protein